MSATSVMGNRTQLGMLHRLMLNPDLPIDTLDLFLS
jgi:hypothetical protein